MACDQSSAPTSPQDGRAHGWIGQPNTRGTIDLLWTSLFTIFVCTFTMLCLNVPAPNEKWHHVTRRKIFWMGLAITGPEFVLTAASGQWGRARDSVKAFRRSGYPNWSIRHAFFADMGGFWFAPHGHNGFPITSVQLHWLVTKGCLEYPQISQRDRWDKSKQDTVAKLITCFQISFLVLQCVGRVVQKLVISTLELSALAIVFCSVMTAICWLRKPANVMTPIRIHSDLTIEEIWSKADSHDSIVSWNQTPLDFIDVLESSWALNIQTFVHMPVGPREQPLPRFHNDRLPNLEGMLETLLCLATLRYASIHLAGWNFTFPSYLELIPWRASSMLMFGLTVAFWMCETTAAWYRSGRWQRIYRRLMFWRRRRESKESENKSLPVAETKNHGLKAIKEKRQLPLPWEFWSIFPLGVLYGAARLYMVVEVFIGLRSLEPSAYINLEWSDFVPHV